MKWFEVALEISMDDKNEDHAIAVARRLVPAIDDNGNELSLEAQVGDIEDAVREVVFSNPLLQVAGLEIESYSVREMAPEEIPPEEIIEWPTGLDAAAAAE
jgi:hypothetical protein